MRWEWHEGSKGWILSNGKQAIRIETPNDREPHFPACQETIDNFITVIEGRAVFYDLKNKWYEDEEV